MKIRIASDFFFVSGKVLKVWKKESGATVELKEKKEAQSARLILKYET